MKVCPRCSEPFADDAIFCPFDGAPLDKTNDRFLGRTIGSRYRLIKKLGSGGMSVVYLARHAQIDRLSAIKILRPELSRITEHRERFLREARAVNRINHPNIVEITDVGESDGFAFLVMEYVRGESLLSQIQLGAMPWERGARIATQVAGALARAHQMGVIHRDLKPENILLLATEDASSAPAPGVELVKLTDFGIAKVMGEPTLTLNEQLFGTPGYIAPEYVGGLPIDGRADIYSLAVVLYEMVTGRLPFEGRGQSDLLLKPLTSAPIPPSKRIDGLPPDLEALLLRALARDPADRPHDAFAFQDALLDIVRRLGDAGGAPERGPRARTAAAREPLSTVVDRVSRAPEGRDPGSAGKIATKEMSSKWSSALADLERLIAAARRRGGDQAKAAARAAELALVAGEMVPRLERAAKVASDLQAKVDILEAVGREFRSNLGNAIDVLVHDRSRERAHLDALRARRLAVESAGEPDAPPVSVQEPGDLEALRAEERRAEAVVEDLGFQVTTLQRQLDARNEEHERELVKATGSLEGSLSALRRLTNEIVRTIDDGFDILQRSA